MTATAGIHRKQLIILSLAMIGGSTLAMAATLPVIWLLSRSVSGIASGLAFVLGSSVVLDYAATQDQPIVVSIAYGGVGLGIAASGILTPLFESLGSWRWAWAGFAVLSLIGTLFVARFFIVGSSQGRHTKSHSQESRVALFPWLLMAYAGEGFGYIIPATFMVAAASRNRILAPYASESWILVGLLAAPSVYFWDRLSKRYARATMLTIALVVQSCGLLVSFVFHNAFGIICGAVSLGATFMGISAMGLAMARDIYPERSNVVVAAMTVAFGIGQTAGPILATGVSDGHSNLEHGTIMAIVALTVSALSMATGVLIIAIAAKQNRAQRESSQQRP